MRRNTFVAAAAALVLSVAVATGAWAQAADTTPASTPPQARPSTTPAVGTGAAPGRDAVPAARPGATVTPPPGYVIGPADVLQVVFWREKDMSAEVVVRPDGMITLPLLNDVRAAGLTPDLLRDKVTELAGRFVEAPNVAVVVRQINSRVVFITGQVAKPGAYPIQDRMTVLQLIAVAGGLTEYARQKDIVIMRSDSGGAVRPAGEPVTYRFNYKEVIARRNLKQNIDLKPGDTVIVP